MQVSRQMRRDGVGISRGLLLDIMMNNDFICNSFIDGFFIVTRTDASYLIYIDALDLNVYIFPRFWEIAD